ncbi:glycosyltransferase family 39 protein [Streptomyces sp. MBT56]|uniref:glycosyltransferase family 39 protein n=1 Tax=unclassified Streptomyces TaxID=2593676 RepID=UPI00190C8BE8|nr:MULTISPECIES: glycosyltransferase family 39 protein [unclassified Streptomyces]MBK3558942.1 glycosyltransferase family 39 protein [Streptomyces sp. MBT56]MBK3605048.1 glycosyltransferase family 39 protein [Streptomyces sp. MBT54]MBK3618760.1 glycosyltransferase family 39 protein [Streptomyces sp. MBT98]
MTTATTTITATAPPPEPDRGSGPSPRWARPALYGLLLAVGLAYVYNLSASGYANSFYSAAVQAGSQSWKALFFGSLDSANAITVDKPPAALWPMALSVRLFGLNSWAILAPQVLMALATAAVLNSAVRRRFGPVAGLIAVAVFALTPVAALMFRFNNPDALLALLMTVTVWCVLRALEQGRTTWLLWAGAAVGFAFLTKTLQAFLILPPLAVLYAVCAPVPVRKRIGQLALSALTMVVAGGWWVAIVELMPTSSRPYVGGSQNNSFLELTFGYNGLGRINGEETGSVGGGGGGRGGGGGWGETGIGRMFNSEVGGQIAWLLPAALILLVAGLWLTRKAARTDSARAAFIAWGGALVMTAAVFSFMAGIFHQYYTVALAPYVAALVAMGVTVLWEERGAWWPRAVLAGTVLATALWAYVLLGRTPDHLPWLRWAVLAGGIAGALGLLVVGRIGGRGLAVAVVGLSCAASLAGPTAYTVSTLNSGHQGSIVTAGPSAGGFGMGGGPGGGGGRPGGPGGGDGGQRGGMQQPPGQGQGQGQGQAQGQAQAQGNQQGNAPGGMPTLPGGGIAPGGTGTAFGEGMRGGGGGGGGMGGLLNGATVDAEAKALLTKDADDYTWVAAAVGAQNAASYQLATGDPVMAIGGFNGSDPSPTLAQFKKYVAEGKIHYFVSGGGTGGGMRGGTVGEGGGGMGGGPGGMGSSGTSSQISSWVTENFTEVTVGSATFYDLTQPVS